MILYKEDIRNLDAIKSYIDSHLDEDLSLGNLCIVFYVSCSTLRRHFSSYYNQTIHHYIHKQRLLSALALLTKRDKGISEVAGLVGYRDRCSFTRAFTKFFGISPIGYLKNKYLNSDNLLQNINLDRNVN